MKPDRQFKISSENLTGLSGGELLRLWKDGNERAADCIVDRYAMRLVALIASRMNRRFRQTAPPEDIVQSALGSFFQAARLSRIQVSQSVSLWNLLATFAKRKMFRAIEKQSAVKRGGHLERMGTSKLLHLWAEDPKPELSTTVSDLIADLENELPVELREILEQALLGKSNSEIAKGLGVAERTVRRRMIRLHETLAPNDSSDTSQHQDVVFVSEWLPRIGYHEFVLGRMIGAGGFGKVYRAAMQSSERDRTPTYVAVKFLRKSFWQNLLAKRSFLREIEQAAKIQHAGVVRYLGWGESPQGGPYVVMQWIDGIPLSQRHAISPEIFVRALKQVCDAVQAVHALGVIHGDLTPANILISQSDQVWITDFGFSQSQLRDSVATTALHNSQSILGGTIGFAAPEQISDSFGHIGIETDIYAIGGLAYWYLTGRPPHAEDSIELGIANTISSNDVDTTSLPSNPPAFKQLKRVAESALRKSIAKRPSSVAELIDVLN